jgi:hypothetical protein
MTVMLTIMTLMHQPRASIKIWGWGPSFIVVLIYFSPAVYGGASPPLRTLTFTEQKL